MGIVPTTSRAPDAEQPATRSVTDDDRMGLRVALLGVEAAEATSFQDLLDQAWPSEVELSHHHDLGELAAQLDHNRIDLIFADLPTCVARTSGVDSIGRVVALAGPIPVVVLLDSDDPSLPARALEIGAQDYLTVGGFDAELLARTLRHSLARSRSDEALRRAAAELHGLNRELEETLGIVAHDLRASLRTGRLFAGRLLTAVEQGDDGRPLGALLDSSLDRMELMLERLLRLADLRAELIAPTEQPLSQALGAVEAELIADLAGIDATVTVERDDRVRFDPVLLRELLRHLVTNSIQYRDPDRPLLVSVEAKAGAGETTISVRDNGVGIAPQHRDRVFRLFERLDNDAAGLGYGLACSRRIVELHGGSIQLLTPPTGQGLEARILVPALV